MVRNRRSLCPREGHYSLEPNQCDNMFIKCENSKGDMRAEIRQCPYGHTYWPISRRCERSSPVLQCGKELNYEHRWEIPIEMIS